MKLNLSLPLILEQQKSPLVRQLLDIIDYQNHFLQQQADQIQQLKDEIARLKNFVSGAVKMMYLWRFENVYV